MKLIRMCHSTEQRPVRGRPPDAAWSKKREGLGGGRLPLCNPNQEAMNRSHPRPYRPAFSSQLGRLSATKRPPGRPLHAVFLYAPSFRGQLLHSLDRAFISAYILTTASCMECSSLPDATFGGCSMHDVNVCIVHSSLVTSLYAAVCSARVGRGRGLYEQTIPIDPCSTAP